MNKVGVGRVKVVVVAVVGVWFAVVSGSLAEGQPAPPPAPPAPLQAARADQVTRAPRPPALPDVQARQAELEQALREMAREQAEQAAALARVHAELAREQAAQARLQADAHAEAAAMALARLDAEMEAAWAREAWQRVSGSVGGIQPAIVVTSCGAVRASETSGHNAERERRFYETGYSALGAGRWELAVDCFSRVAEMKGQRADGALYWKAYAQNKLSQTAEALATLAELRRRYPKSRYLADAQALDVEIRERAGETPAPDIQEDDELKLLALRALQNVEPERAVGMLERFLRRAESPKLKERALFVLAQSRSDRARQVLAAVARGEYNPDLQVQALRLIGYAKTPETRALLDEVYRSTADVEVRRLVVRAWGVLGERDRLVDAARGDLPAEVRVEAVRQLGVLKATDVLWDLYQRERDVAIRRQILQALPAATDTERLGAIARTERDPDLRRTAIRSLGAAPVEKSGATLVAIYEDPTSDTEVKKAVIQALAIQRNDVALVSLARKEKDRALRKELVERLSTMKTKAALDYLLEILGK